MPRMRCATIAVALSLAALVPAAAEAAPPGTLYVQQAGGGSIERAGEGWTLTLTDPAPRVTTFADRPARVGGWQRLRSFVGGWDAAFGRVAPNAALEIEGAPAARDVLLLELGAPALRDGAVVYEVRPIRGSVAPRLVAFARRADRAGRGGRAFGRATLFIDDGSAQTPFVLSWTGPAAPIWSVSFESALIGSTTIMQDFLAGDVLRVEPDGVTGQGWPGAATFTGALGGQLTLPPGGGPVTGVATVPAGMTIQLQLGDGPAATIADGPFSVPAP